MTSLETQVTSNRISLQDTRQLSLLETVSLQESNLLVAREQNVLRNKLVVGNVYEQVILEEALNLGQGLYTGERLAGGGRKGNVGDHDASLVVVGDDVRRELADLAHAERLVGEELDPDGAAVWHWVGLVGSRWGGELSQHGFAGTG